MDIPLLFEKEYRYEGIAVGGGLTYGYFMPFSKRWGAEFTDGTYKWSLPVIIVQGRGAKTVRTAKLQQWL